MTPIKQITDWINPPCNGPRIRYREDGAIEVADRGVLTSNLDFGKVNKWRSEINAAAKKHGIPPAWIAGIMLRESNGRQDACSPCQSNCCSTINPGCCAHGLLQLTQPTARAMAGKDVGQQIFDPKLNLDLGAKLLRENADKSHACIVCILAMYNAGSVKCGKAAACAAPGMFNVVENCGYVEGCVRAINSAIIEQGYAGTPLTGSTWVWPAVLFSVGVASVGVLGYVASRELRQHNPVQDKGWRDRARERNAGAAWFRSLDTAAKWEVGDAFVLGEFDWRDWFDRKPSRHFYDGADEARIDWEISRGS